MRELKNTFSWSWSRHRAFETCPRRYWLQHYGFWGGWQGDAPEEVREIYLQKRLSSRAQWMGTAIHEAAERLLKSVRAGRYPPREAVLDQVRRQARRALEDSARGLYRLNPKRHPGLLEHYYGEPVPAETWTQAVDEIVRQVDGLFENPVFSRLLQVPERIREVEELQQVLVGDVPVWVSLDVLVEDGEGGFVVIDWKTGRGHEADEVAAQLGVYGVYVLQAFLGVQAGKSDPPVDRVKTLYANLRTGERDVRPLTLDALQAARDTIARSAAAMRERLVDVDENVARLEDFPMLPEGAEACGRCPFRRTCEREVVPAG